MIFLRTIAILIVTLVVFFTADFQGKEEIDTLGYVHIAQYGFSSEFLGSRPWGYPLLLKFAYLFSNEPYPVVVFIQCLSYILSFILLIILTSKIEQLKHSKIAIVVLLIAFLNPQSLGFLSIILPEIFPLIFVIFAIIFTIKNISNVNQVLFYAISITIPILFKPLWLYLLILPISKLIIYRKNQRAILMNGIFPLILCLSFYTFHTLLNKTFSKGNIIASTMDVNLNLALIRSGITHGAEGTKLFDHLREHQLLKYIEGRNWYVHKEKNTEFEEFTMIKNSIPWEIREDKHYWKKVLVKPQNLSKFLMIQFNRIPYFFTTSGSIPEIDFKNSFINYIYFGIYEKAHKILILPLFLLFTFRLVRSRKQSTLYEYFVPWLVIIVGAIILSLLTYQNAHFIRMRALLEVLLLIVCFGELAYWLNVFKIKIFKYFKIEM